MLHFWNTQVLYIVLILSYYNYFDLIFLPPIPLSGKWVNNFITRLFLNKYNLLGAKLKTGKILLRMWCGEITLSKISQFYASLPDSQVMHSLDLRHRCPVAVTVHDPVPLSPTTTPDRVVQQTGPPGLRLPHVGVALDHSRALFCFHQCGLTVTHCKTQNSSFKNSALHTPVKSSFWKVNCSEEVYQW